MTDTRVTVLDTHDVAELAGIAEPSGGGHLMTTVVELPPGSAGTPPHRHSGPVYGYMVEGAMLFELEGEPPRVIRAGEAFSEPGGDVIHYRAANHLDDVWSRFVVVMVCRAGEPMMTFPDAAELESRRHLRHAAAVSPT